VIQSVRRAALILKELGSSPRLGVTELGERLGLAKATVFGLLRALEAEQLVERDDEAGKYRLGPAMLQLGNAFLDNHELRPDNSVQILEVGASIPWHACALGKAMAAYLEAEQRSELLDEDLARLTGKTVCDPAALDRELDQVARRGVAFEDQEAIVGEAEIAATVFDHGGAPVGAIGVAGPVERLLSDGPSPHVVAAVRETARSLSREMGAGRLSVRAR
jgi:DNA-binding IclR family transcriptional regulator